MHGTREARGDPVRVKRKGERAKKGDRESEKEGTAGSDGTQ